LFARLFRLRIGADLSALRGHLAVTTSVDAPLSSERVIFAGQDGLQHLSFET
jgi:hypothetical protein